MNPNTLRILVLALAVVALSARCGGNGGGNETDADADAEDVTPADGEDTPAEVADDVLDAADVEVPETVTITGQVWVYSLTMSTTYTVEPIGDVEVTVLGDGITPGDLTATTGTAHCDDWWDLGTSFECGKFEIADVPAGAEIMLEVAATSTDDPDTLSEIFVAGPGIHKVLVLVRQDLIDAMLTTWSMTQDAGDGMVVGLLAENLNPDPIYELGSTSACPDDPSACAVSGFIGGATVACTDCDEIVYFDSDDYTNTDRTDTDPAQSLFFILNVPTSEMSDPNTLSVTHSTHTIGDVDFTVEAGNITYLLLMP